MKNLITLVKMQLKEKLNLKRFENEKLSAFQILVAVVASLVKFAVVTAVFAVLIFLINFIGILSYNGIIPVVAMSLVLGIMIVTSIFSCTIGLTNSIYFSRDNAILLTLPCRPIQVYLSKIIIFFVFELKRNFGFMLPMFFAYFITHNYPIYAYFWLVICFVFISLFTVALSSIFSVAAMWISNIFRQNRILQIATLLTIIAAVSVALFYAVSLIPDNLDLSNRMPIIAQQINLFLVDFSEKAKLFYEMTLAVIGVHHTSGFGFVATRFALLIGMIIVLLAISLLLVLPLFYKMASKPFEYLKKSVKPRQNRVVSKKLTGFITEAIITVKNPARAFSNVGILISIPFLTFLLNKMFLAMNTDELGNSMVVAFTVLIILLVALNSNVSAASIYSRDGRSAYLIKTQPTNPAILLFSKLLPDALFTLISLIATIFILSISSRLGILNSTILMLGIIFIYFAHRIYCAELDIMNPQHEIYATVGASDINPNETNATITAFIISFVVAAVSALLLLDKSQAIPTIVINDALSISTVYLKILAVGLALMIWRLVVYFSKIKLYYKEK